MSSYRRRAAIGCQVIDWATKVRCTCGSWDYKVIGSFPDLAAASDWLEAGQYPRSYNTRLVFP